MTPASILAAYNQGKRYFPSTTWWFRFLRIAASGEAGVDKAELFGYPNIATGEVIKAWLRKGLIRKTTRKVPTGRPRVCYVIGPRGQQYLDRINQTDDQQ